MKYTNGTSLGTNYMCNLSGLGQLGIGKILTANFPPFSNICLRFARWDIPLIEVHKPTGGKHQYVKCKRHSKRVPGPVIGVSLSEPHTSVTALLDVCVCLFACDHIPKFLIERTDTYISNLDTCTC